MFDYYSAKQFFCSKKHDELPAHARDSNRWRPSFSKTRRIASACARLKRMAIFFIIFYFLFNLGRSFSVQHNTVLPWLWGVQTVRRYPDRNWLRGLCHPLHLPHKSDTVMERAAIAMETNFWALPGIESGTLRTRVKHLNHDAPLLLAFRARRIAGACARSKPMSIFILQSTICHAPTFHIHVIHIVEIWIIIFSCQFS